jgi:hypothetical protein
MFSCGFTAPDAGRQARGNPNSAAGTRQIERRDDDRVLRARALLPSEGLAPRNAAARD